MIPEDVRLQLLEGGYCPLPLNGKVPVLKAWQKRHETTREEIAFWSRAHPAAQNTGVLTRLTPTLDIDILDPDAAKAVEDLARDRFGERSAIIARFGNRPKRAIPFRATTAFAKIALNFVAADGAPGEKIEFLCDGQQVVVDGVHPETHRPYEWFGGSPLEIPRDDLPSIDAGMAKTLVADATELLVGQFGYRLLSARRAPRNGAGAGDDQVSADWQAFFDNIREGHELHDSLRDLAAKMVAARTNAGAVVNQLRALMEASTALHDDRWKERLDDIPRLVESAVAKINERPRPTGPPSTLAQTLGVFDKWLALKDHTAVLAALGAAAANFLDGDPCWLGIVGPGSSAKTEIINSLSRLPHVEPSATLTAAALLSGTPNKDRDKTAKGGLLRKIGEFGILCVKDFGSILSMHTETRAEVLAALREIADGEWTRHVGVDGGRTLHWKGKMGLVFAVTPVIDAFHSVISSLGDRWLLTRMAPTKGQFEKALVHRGAATKQMRAELAEAVERLFAGRRQEPREISADEIKRIGDTVALMVRLRGAVERDRRTRELDIVYGAEGPARVGLALERLLAGLDTLGVERGAALDVVVSVALASVPPQRRQAYELAVAAKRSVTTSEVATALGLPTNTVRRVLEDLAAYGLIKREGGEPGKADKWTKADWEAEE